MYDNIIVGGLIVYQYHGVFVRVSVCLCVCVDVSGDGGDG